MSMTREMDNRMSYFYSEALLAVQSRDWGRFREIAFYDAETAAYLIKLFEDMIPLETKCEISLGHYCNHGDFYPVLRKIC